MNASIQTVIANLENLFSTFNKEIFEDKLENPVITVSPDTTVGAYGWCTSWKAWQDGSGNGYYEINLTAEYLNRPFHEICETLIHEMVHLKNLYEGVQDTSRGGFYHNKKFKDSAENCGLVVTKDNKYGWCRTTLNPQTMDMVEKLNGQDFGLVRSKVTKAEKASKGKSSSIKYVCPQCGMIIRATKEVRVICGDCDVELEKEG